MASGFPSQGQRSLVPFRGVLHDVAKHLKKTDVAHIAFQFPKLSTSQRDKIHDGIELFEELERIGELSDQNVDRLIEAIDKLQLHEPLKLLKGYKVDHMTRGVLERSRNEITSPVKIINLSADVGTIKTGDQAAYGGNVAIIQNIAHTKLETDESDLLDQSTTLIVPNASGSNELVEGSSETIHPEDGGDKTSTTCTEHVNLVLNKYCLTCKKRLCAECFFTSHKNQCKIIAIGDIAKEVQEVATKFQKGVKAVSDSCEVVTVDFDRKQKAHLKNLSDLEKEIREDAMKMRELIDKEECKLLSLVHENQTEIANVAKHHNDKCSNVTSQIGQMQLDFTRIARDCKDFTHLDNLINLQEKVNALQDSLEQQYSCLNESFEAPVYQRVLNKGLFGQLKSWRLLGGVIIKPNQIVHIYDNRKSTKNVLIVCFHPNDSKHIFWQYEENRVSSAYPVVISRRAMYYREYFHVLFACGKTVYVMHFHSDGSSYDSVKQVEMIEVDSLGDGVWITRLFCHQPSGKPCDDFILSTSSSDSILEYSISLKEKRIIKLNGFLAPLKINSIAYLKNRFAIIDEASNRVKILEVGRENVQLSYLAPVVSSSVYKPVEVISTGARWIVLFLNEHKDSKVLVYKIKTGDMKVCDEGERVTKGGTPLSVTHCQRKGYLSFSNNDLRSFDF